jgi:bla regulator protein BlaR1
MEALFTTLTTSIPSTKILAFLIDMTWKSSCILLFTYAFMKLFRRLSSSTRHAIWSMAVAGVLLLPIFSLLLPAWPVTVPVTFSSNIALDSGIQLPEPSGTTQDGLSSVSSENAAGDAASLGTVKSVAESARSEAGLNASPSPPLKESILQSVGTMVATHGILIIVSVWSLGMIAVFLRQLVGKTLVVWMALRAEKITDSSLLKLADELRTKHGIKRRVKFLKSMKAGMPMTWGFFRPTILLPGEADAWSRDHQRFVLVHELAHVKRWDCLTQLLAQLSKTLYWFNPLVWMAHREFLKEREHA